MEWAIKEQIMALILTFIRSMHIILLDYKPIISTYMITFLWKLYVIRKINVATLIFSNIKILIIWPSQLLRT